MEVEIVSTECIKPSSPTPHHLKTYKFSAIDQFMPPIYVSMVFFYPVDGQDTDNNDLDISKRSLLLKQSLSETLTLFYPLAGKIKEKLVGIDCTDEGVYYVEARVNHIPLAEYLKRHDVLSSLNSFLPGNAQAQYSHLTTAGSHVAMIQETTFACGGFVIGVCISHLFTDGAAFSSILTAWAATARKFCNDKEEIAMAFPSFDAPSLFPQDETLEASPMSSLFMPCVRTGKPVLRRFLFEELAISDLQAKVISSKAVENPTRVQVVSALLGKCFIDVRKARTGVQRPTLIVHNVNMRRRAVPQLPKSSIGNITCMTTALYKAEAETRLPGLVNGLQEAMGKIDGEFVKNIQGEGAMEKLYKATKEATSSLTNPEFSTTGVDCILFTSWCNFGLYDVDFGWGKPAWVTGKGAPGESETLFMDTIILTDARKGKGIEAWVITDEEEMLLLERNHELLEFASTAA